MKGFAYESKSVKLTKGQPFIKFQLKLYTYVLYWHCSFFISISLLSRLNLAYLLGRW